MSANERVERGGRVGDHDLDTSALPKLPTGPGPGADHAHHARTRQHGVILFVGGPRHGTTTPTDTPNPPPALWRDLTGEHWALGEIACDLKTLGTGQPEGRWRVAVYLHPSIPQNQHLPAYLDALNYWHLHQHGHRVDQPDAAARTLYLVHCPTCPITTVLAFDTLTDRATWARTHIEATGHKIDYSQREETSGGDQD